MQPTKDAFACAEIIKFEKPGNPIIKKRHHNKKANKPVMPDDVTEIDQKNGIDDMTAVDEDTANGVTVIDSDVQNDDVTLVDEDGDITIMDPVANNDDVTMVDD